jgi:hypothetical protein
VFFYGLIINVGTTHNFQKIGGVVCWNGSTSPYTQRVSKFGKKYFKKYLVDIKFMSYLWGGGWAWLSIHISI